MSRILLVALLVFLPSAVPQGSNSSIATSTAGVVTSTSLNSINSTGTLAPSIPPGTTLGTSGALLVVSTTAGSAPSEAPPAGNGTSPPGAVNISTTVSLLNATSAAVFSSSTTPTSPEVTSTTVPPSPVKPNLRPPSFAIGSFFIGLVVGVIITLGVGAGIFLFRKRTPSNASVGYRPYP